MRRLQNLYPSQATSDSDFPYGKFQNSQFEGDPSGTPLEATWANEIWGAIAAILADASISPNNNPETRNASQIRDAIRTIADRRANYAFTGMHNGNVVMHVPLTAPGGQSLWVSGGGSMTQVTLGSNPISLPINPPGGGWRPTRFDAYVVRHDTAATHPLTVMLKRRDVYSSSSTPTTVASFVYSTSTSFRSASFANQAAIADNEALYAEVTGQWGGTNNQPWLRAIRVHWTPVG